MNYSFALIISRNSNIDYHSLLRTCSKYFDVNFHNVSSTNANAIHLEKQFFLDVTPSKIQFLFPEVTNKDIYDDAIDSIKKYINNFFENETIGIQYFDMYDDYLIRELDNVNCYVL